MSIWDNYVVPDKRKACQILPCLSRHQISSHALLSASGNISTRLGNLATNSGFSCIAFVRSLFLLPPYTHFKCLYNGRVQTWTQKWKCIVSPAEWLPQSRQYWYKHSTGPDTGWSSQGHPKPVEENKLLLICWHSNMTDLAYPLRGSSRIALFQAVEIPIVTGNSGGWQEKRLGKGDIKISMFSQYCPYHSGIQSEMSQPQVRG